MIARDLQVAKGERPSMLQFQQPQASKLSNCRQEPKVYSLASLTWQPNHRIPFETCPWYTGPVANQKVCMVHVALGLSSLFRPFLLGFPFIVSLEDCQGHLAAPSDQHQLFRYCAQLRFISLGCILMHLSPFSFHYTQAISSNSSPHHFK